MERKRVGKARGGEGGDDDHSSNARKHERGEEGRDQEVGGSAHHAKIGGVCVCQVICERREREGVTGGATGGQKGGQTGQKGRGGGGKEFVRGRMDERGKCVR